jgi:two-component system response regulator EvgA
MGDGVRVGQNAGMSRSVVIVDDHPSFRLAARMLLEDDGYTVIGEADDGRSGVDTVVGLAPDVVLLDVNLPDVDGLEVARRLTGESAPGRIVVVSSRDAADFGGLVEASGARGFICKGDLTPAALEAVLA